MGKGNIYGRGTLNKIEDLKIADFNNAKVIIEDYIFR